MNSHLNQLHPYPFARLHEAMQGITPPEGISAARAVQISRRAGLARVAPSLRQLVAPPL